MKFSVVVMTLLLAMVGGCASVETVREARGQGEVRTYPVAYETACKAVLAAAKTKGLEIVENDKDGGRVVLSHGVTLWSWGERIAVFVRSTSATTTEVEIVSKPVMSPLNFPPDWQRILLDQIAVELRTMK